MPGPKFQTLRRKLEKQPNVRNPSALAADVKRKIAKAARGKKIAKAVRGKKKS